MMQSRGLYGESEADIIAQDAGDKGILIFNRPAVHNAFNLSMVCKTYETLLKWEKEKTMVITKGAGGKAFSSGGDIPKITLACQNVEDRENYAKVLFRKEYMTNFLVATYAIPYVALINGITMGGGLGVSVHCPYRVATEKTLTAMPEAAVGHFPDVGASYFLPRLKGNLGIYLALTGFRLKGVDNLFVGIATHYCPSSEIHKIEKNLLNSCNPRDTLKPYQKPPPSTKFSLEPLLSKIDFIFGAPSVEEIVQGLKQDGSDWSKETLATLERTSPLSLKVTLKELQLGAHLTLRECLQMEYRLADRSCEGYNFIEGWSFSK